MKKSTRENKTKRALESDTSGLENLPKNKYESIDMRPVWQFVSTYLLNDRSDRSFVESTIKFWLVNKGFLDRLGKFYLPKLDISKMDTVALQFLSMKFLRVFRDEILPDFFLQGKFSSDYKSAKRTCSQLIAASKRGRGKQLVFTAQS